MFLEQLPEPGPLCGNVKYKKNGPGVAVDVKIHVASIGHANHLHPDLLVNHRMKQKTSALHKKTCLCFILAQSNA